MKKNRIAVIVLIALALLVLWRLSGKDPVRPEDAEEVALRKCVDGDTAVFARNGEEIRVRFLAVDAPEMASEEGEEPYARQASEETCRLLEEAQTIRLEYQGENREDRYGRVLAFVWADDTLVELDLVEKGYAEVRYLEDAYTYTPRLLKAQEKARRQGIGIWRETEDD